MHTRVGCERDDACVPAVPGGARLIPLNDLSRLQLPEATRSAVLRLLETGPFMHGSYVPAFERAFSQHFGLRSAVGVANGTDALELALRAVGVASGDHVGICPNAGGYAYVAVRCIGAHPIFIDVDLNSHNMSAASLEEVMTKTPMRAIVFTHLYGDPHGVDAVAEIAKSGGAILVEDCAQAHGARLDGRPVGTFGAAAAFSFYPTKNLGSAGDAGAVASADDEVIERVRCLAQYGWAERYRIELPGGRNSRLDEIQALILTARLDSFDEAHRRRREIAGAYLASDAVRSAAVRGFGEGAEHANHLFVVRSADRNAVIDGLRERGVGSAIHYPHLDPGASQCSVARRACETVLSVPMFPSMTDHEVSTVAGELAAALTRP